MIPLARESPDGIRCRLKPHRLLGAIAAQASDSSMTWFYRPCPGSLSAQPRELRCRAPSELAENGIEVGRHRVARLMRGDGLSFKKTTDSQHNKAVASNLLDQNFSAEAPNEKWAPTSLYLDGTGLA